MKSSKILGCFTVLLVLVLFCSVMANVFFIARLDIDGISFGTRGRGESIKPPEFRVMQIEAAAGGATQDRIAQIDITGVISGEDVGMGSMVTEVKQELRQAVEDKSIKAIVLRIDSPGGEVTASDTIYRAVKEAQADKPVVVFMDTVAASGGYYIACGAGKIICHPTAITGSIGVIMQGVGYSDLLGKVGVEMRTFKSGSMKDAGSGSRVMTADEKEYFQKLVLQNYDRFIGIVSAARKISPDELKAGLADGRIFLGEEAAGKKLVDATGYIEDAYASAKELGGVADAEIIRYMRPPRFLDLLGLRGESKAPASTPKIEIDVSERLLPRLKPGLCYYLPGAWAQ